MTQPFKAIVAVLSGIPLSFAPVSFSRIKLSEPLGKTSLHDHRDELQFLPVVDPFVHGNLALQQNLSSTIPRPDITLDNLCSTLDPKDHAL